MLQRVLRGAVGELLCFVFRGFIFSDPFREELGGPTVPILGTLCGSF